MYDEMHQKSFCFANYYFSFHKDVNVYDKKIREHIGEISSNLKGKCYII